MIPRATYRLQFHQGFTFADAMPLAPYLADLGISHVYSSPIGVAREGSTHGYDQVDPTQIDPNLGGEAGFRRLAAALRDQGLGVILDIVPNHMAVGGADNRWWLDVLENGPDSAFADMFDIDWQPADPALQDKVLAPFLATPYGEALAGGALKLTYDEAAGALAVIAEGAHRFPIRREDYADVLSHGEAALTHFDPADEAGRNRLHNLLERQHYRLAWWRTADDQINWRRFFNITQLAGVRVERPAVFALIHALPFRLYAEGLIDGLRIDHVDGLSDPGAYCRRLRESLDALKPNRPADANPWPAYIVVEKILAAGERLPAAWNTDGTTGYEYMNLASALLHDGEGVNALGRYWGRISGRPETFEVEERAARLEILAHLFQGQLDAVVDAFHRLAQADLSTRDLTTPALGRAITTLLSVYPAYRTYSLGDAPMTQAEAALLDQAVDAALPHTSPGEEGALMAVAAWLRGQGPGEKAGIRDAVRRFHQLSAPISAKAVEDTAFYRFGPLLSRNDVGFDPTQPACSIAEFHRANLARNNSFPHTLLATATHDHKRGEDVRARLAVLSEVPTMWTQKLSQWRATADALASPPPAGAVYTLFQTLVGAWPPNLSAVDAIGLDAFRTRIEDWQVKAQREAGLATSWASPDLEYEDLCNTYLKMIFDPACAWELLADLKGFVDHMAPVGALNGLVQALLRCTVPGVPDTYQGTEFWDLSLVDPDNRRPVDFQARQAALASGLSTADLAAQWRDGRIKQRVIARALALRKAAPDLFSQGDYEPLEVTGPRAQHVLAFARRQGEHRLITATALHCAAPCAGQTRLTPHPDWWADTRLHLPQGGTGWRDQLGDGAAAGVEGGAIAAAELFGTLPVGLLVGGV